MGVFPEVYLAMVQINRIVVGLKLQKSVDHD